MAFPELSHVARGGRRVTLRLRSYSQDKTMSNDNTLLTKLHFTIHVCVYVLAVAHVLPYVPMAMAHTHTL